MNHRVIPIRYDAARNRSFQVALKQRVQSYLRTQPNGRLATPFMWLKVGFYLVTYATTVALLTLVEHSLAVTAGLIVLLSVLCVGLAYNISHDAVHGALSKKRWLNEALFYVTFNLLGPNAYLWKLRHKVMHHSAVNIAGFDFNIEVADILRFSPTQQWRPIHRYQHLYAPFAYLLFTFHWMFVKDFKMLTLERIGNISEIRHPRWRIMEVAGWKMVHIGYLVVLPALALDVALWQVLLAYVFYQALTSFLFVITFTGSHLNEGMVFVEPGQDNTVPHSFLEHALRTSLDFDPTHPLVSFWLGGFNAHVAHHMFPNVCSVHYPRITRIIQKTAAEFGMPYQQTTTGRIFVQHFRYLKQLGQDADAPRAAYLHRTV